MKEFSQWLIQVNFSYTRHDTLRSPSLLSFGIKSSEKLVYLFGGGSKSTVIYNPTGAIKRLPRCGNYR